MKRNDLFMLMAMFAALGVVLGLTLRDTTEASGVPAKEMAGAGASAVAGKAKGVPAVKEQAARLLGISIRPVDGGKRTDIEVETSRRADYRVLHLDNPDRLVLDLEGARNSTNLWRYNSDSPLVARVRVGRFSPEHGGIIRVVADLKGNPTYHVSREAAGFRIELTPKDGALPKATPPASTLANHPGKASSQEKAAVRREVAETVMPRPRSHLKTKSETYKTPTAVPQPTSTSAAASATRPPAVGTRDRRAKAKPQKKQPMRQALQAARAAKLATSPEGPDLSKTVVPIHTSQDLDSGPKYTGKRISLNLKGVDLKDFFRLIHEVSGLNIIVDPDVSGTVTLVLDDVPWDQALDLVLDNNGLGDRLEGNVLRIARISTLTREHEDERKLSEAKEDSEPLETVFRHLNYAKAAMIASLLKTWAGGGALSHRGSVLVDERTNTLIISDISSHIPRIESVIDKLDKKAQQISIQARIIRATSDFVRNLSTTLSFAQRNGSSSITMGGATGNPVSGQPVSPPTVTTSPATGFGVFVLSNLGRYYAINAAISAAETHDQAKTISQPSIVTQNNVEGTVIQGTQIPIQTTINNTISVQYVQASLELKVTPQVTQDGNVFLTIDVQNSSPGPSLTFAGPTINTQSATTQVLVPNGGTVIFGGVTVHSKSNSSTGVPWLGSIPILGHLFKSTSKSTNDQELLFFVTPKILT